MSPVGVLGLDFPAVIAVAALGGPLSPEGGALFALALPEADAAAVKGLRRGDDS